MIIDEKQSFSYQLLRNFLNIVKAFFLSFFVKYERISNINYTLISYIFCPITHFNDYVFISRLETKN